MKANAFALYGKEDVRPLALEVPAVEPGAVLLRVNCCGICGSDLRMFFDGPSPRYPLPVILGHEFSATVEVCGPNVTHLKPGDVVVVAPLIPCMHCRPCARGQDNLCEQARVIGVNVAGGIATHFYAPEQLVAVGGLVKLKPEMDIRAAALTEIVACCLHGIRQTEFEAGASALIVGEGPVGLAHLQLLRLMGAGEVIVTGTFENRLKLAEALGATAALDINRFDLRSYLDDRRLKPDLAIVAAAVVPATQTALEVVRPGGSVLFFSGYPAGTTMPFDLYKFHYAEKHVHGSIDCTLRDFHDAAELMPRLKMGELITHALPLEETPRAFREARGPAAIKTVIAP